ncbi:MAG TPA: glycosyltransferase family 4 protein [Bryobacteraceae bacterium]|jgi:glycosyltransferase involved in cell wall biosynthesis
MPDQRLRILMLITRAELGGGQTHVADLLRGLRDDFDVHLATGETGYLTDVARELDVRTHILPSLIQPFDVWRDMAALRQCVQLIREIQPDLVHAHTSKAGFIGRAAAKWTGVPSVYTAHTWCFAEGTSPQWRLAGTPLERLAARWCGRMISVSDANRTLALNNGVAGPEKHVTIHNGIADHAMRAQPEENAAVPRIIMVARFAPQKAQALLVEAVRTIADVPFELVFVGDGPTRAAVEKQVVDAGLDARVKFLGERLEVPELLASAHIAALFTHWEGFPISILEAMRAGLPTVVSDVGGVREAIDESCGRIIAPGDVVAFRAALAELLRSAELRGRLGAAARSRYERHFTADVMLAKTIEVYRGVVADPARVLAGKRISGVGQHET